MSIIGQQIAYSNYLKQNEKLVKFVDETEEVKGFQSIPYHEKFKLELTQEDIDNPKNSFIIPNHPTYLIIIKTPEPSEELKQKVSELEKTLFPGSNSKFLFLKPHVKIGRDIAYSWGYKNI